MSCRLMILTMVLVLGYYCGACAQHEKRQGRPAQEQLRVTVVDGLSSYLYQLEAASGIGELVRLTYNQHQLKLEGFPASAEDYRKTDVVVFANAGIRLLTDEQLHLLKEAVAAGTGLMILGGKIAYGASGIRGSVLDEVLPVEIADTLFDLEPAAGELRAEQREVLGRLSIPRNLVCPYVHRVRVRSHGRVQMSVGEKPFLVSGSYGKGRVICLVGTLHGAAPAGKEMFHRWRGFSGLMSRALHWLAGSGPRARAAVRSFSGLRIAPLPETVGIGPERRMYALLRT